MLIRILKDITHDGVGYLKGEVRTPSEESAHALCSMGAAEAIDRKTEISPGRDIHAPSKKIYTRGGYG